MGQVVHTGFGNPAADGAAIDQRVFQRHEPVECPGPLVANVVAEGETSEFAWTVGMIPVASTAAKAVIDTVSPGSVQWFPLTVRGEPDARWLMNVLHEVDCIDPERTEGFKFPENHRRAGEWSSIMRLMLRPGSSPDHHIFWTKGWVAMVLSGRLRSELDAHGFNGLHYTSLSPTS